MRNSYVKICFTACSTAGSACILARNVIKPTSWMLTSCTKRKIEYNYSILLFSCWLQCLFSREESSGPSCHWNRQKHHQRAQSNSLQAGRWDCCHRWDSPALRQLWKIKWHSGIPLPVAKILCMPLCSSDWGKNKSIKSVCQICFSAFFQNSQGLFQISSENNTKK